MTKALSVFQSSNAYLLELVKFSYVANTSFHIHRLQKAEIKQ